MGPLKFNATGEAFGAGRSVSARLAATRAGAPDHSGALARLMFAVSRISVTSPASKVRRREAASEALAVRSAAAMAAAASATAAAARHIGGERWRAGRGDAPGAGPGRVGVTGRARRRGLAGAAIR